MTETRRHLGRLTSGCTRTSASVGHLRRILLALAGEPHQRWAAVPKSRWKVWVDCGTNEKAERAIARTFELALPDMRSAFEVDLYLKGGFVGRYLCDHDGRWNDVVVDLISAGQRLGTGWVLYGDVRSELEAMLSKSTGARFHVPSVTTVSWKLAQT